MRKVFHDEALEDHFVQNGYVKVQLLDTAHIEALTSFYHELTRDNSPDGFFSTIGESTAMKKSMHQHFKQYFTNLWSAVLVDYKPVFSNFITKKSADSKMNYHQDWSFIEERTGKCSLNIWCPLVKTFHENGNLVIVPGSHHLAHQLRFSNVNYAPYGKYQYYFNNLTIALPTAAGEAIIFDNAVVHGSTPNLQGSNRLTISILAIPQEEQLVIHILTDDKKDIDLYKVNDDYLLNYNPFTDIPPRKFLYKQVPFKEIENPLEELIQVGNRSQNKTVSGSEKPGFFKRLMAGFS